MEYQSIQSAAEGLLGEVVEIIAGREEYVVVGGWSPYLLNSHPISHPGTRDVDLLFRSAARKGSLESIVKLFIEHRFLHSAKHEFQLLRILNVAGVDFVFNVDLLHPGQPKSKVAEFVHHLELPVPLHKFRSTQYAAMSIGLPGGEFLFDGYIDSLPRQFDLPNGNSAELRVPLMREIGTIVSKSSTVLSQKRIRDGFDVFAAISQARNRKVLLDDFARLKQNNPDHFETAMSHYRNLHNDSEKSLDLATRVIEIIPAAFRLEDVTSASIISHFAQLLGDVEPPQAASHNC